MVAQGVGGDMAEMIEIRRLGLGDAPGFRALRLRALRDHPADFGADFVEEGGRNLGHFVGQLADNHVMGAWVGGALVGIVAIEFKSKAKERHRGFLWGVYVSPEGRGRGVAPALLDAALAVAFARVEQVELGVRVGNERAEGLYGSRGFVRYGVEPGTYRVAGVSYDSALMVARRE